MSFKDLNQAEAASRSAPPQNDEVADENKESPGPPHHRPIYRDSLELAAARERSRRIDTIWKFAAMIIVVGALAMIVGGP